MMSLESKLTGYNVFKNKINGVLIRWLYLIIYFNLGFKGNLHIIITL